MHKVETLVPGSSCLMAHRGNPHVDLWPYDNPSERFFDVYKPCQLSRLIRKLRRARKEGFTVFGLQMAPGSIQGFFFHLFLKRLKALDFIVDFNLINADIITSPRGDYILDLHLNQISDLFKMTVPEHYFGLKLPVQSDELSDVKRPIDKFVVGIHPWSRRGDLSSFVWPFEKWVDIINFLATRNVDKITIFGKDSKFDMFKKMLINSVSWPLDIVNYECSNSVIDLIKTLQSLDLLISVNTSVIHIGYALGLDMLVLSGPSLCMWMPKGENIRYVFDEDAKFPGGDKFSLHSGFPRVERIRCDQVIEALSKFI